jgi:hypothetical protein
MKSWKDIARQKQVEKPDLRKANRIDFPRHIHRKVALNGITRPIVAAVVIHGRRVANTPGYFEKMVLLGYVVVMRGRRVVTAFYDRGLM